MIKNLVRNIFLSIKWYNKNVKISKNAIISPSSSCEGFNRFAANSRFSGSIGKYSYIGENSYIYGDVGRFCSIGSDVRIISATHPAHIYVSTHPAFYSLKKQCGTTFVDKQIYDEFLYNNKKNIGVTIGNDVWIGSNAIILGGVLVGDGAIVAMGSVVTKNVEPYSIVGGNPAKLINYRFNDEIVDKMLELKWWENKDAFILDNVKRFRNIDDFLRLYN